MPSAPTLEPADFVGITMLVERAAAARGLLAPSDGLAQTTTGQCNATSEMERRWTLGPAMSTEP
jgi:hypothetical protein